jgi:hypothetical protein
VITVLTTGIFVNNLKRRGKNPPKATPKAEDMLGWLPWNLSKPKGCGSNWEHHHHQAAGNQFSFLNVITNRFNNTVIIIMYTLTRVVGPFELVQKVTDTPGETAQAKPSLQGVEGKELPGLRAEVVVRS